MKQDNHARHPLGTQARVLLTSVFGPYARDDEYGSRTINPMELYHNQVTRVQGPFSLRMFHHSFGLMMIQANIEAPCSLLDFPNRERFIEELRTHQYDIVGISGIMPNFTKIKMMCDLVREYLPAARIVIGGHVANMPDLDMMLDADHVVKGDGISWFRRYLGQDEDAPVKHPVASSAFGTRVLGMTLKGKPEDTAAILIPSVGCPMGCNFCSTSHMFGGKGKSVCFFDSGDELFSVMCQIEKKLGIRSFFAMDENFLLHRQRALRLLELMEEHNKSWSLYVFSSARVLSSYTTEQLVALGISWVWMGLEGEDSQYAKLSGIDTRELIRSLQSNGIRVLGSSIVGLENHRPETFEDVINWSASHDTDFHQFMLYTPVPGTPLYAQHEADGTLLSREEIPCADTHGQDRFNYRHKTIPAGEETEMLLRAFRRDFDVNGPSVGRMIRTTFLGWLKHKNHPSERVRDRYRWEARGLSTTLAGSIWAMKQWYRKDERLHEKYTALYKEMCREFGWKTRLLGPVIGSIVLVMIRREADRLARGWTYEPDTNYIHNPAALALVKDGQPAEPGVIAECPQPVQDRPAARREEFAAV